MITTVYGEEFKKKKDLGKMNLVNGLNLISSSAIQFHLEI